MGGFFMLFVFNKAKIISYIVSVFTVIALFAVANYWNESSDSLQVTANITNNQVNENININLNN